MPVATDFSALAPHLQAIVGVMIFIVSGVWIVVKFFRPFIDSTKPTAPASSKQLDAVVISASLADSKPIAELTQSIDRLCESNDKGNIINHMLYEAIIKLHVKL